ncbi:MAG: sulfotransferase family protein, partial [Candidatus Heimdallarchaeaceae archaeon]
MEKQIEIEKRLFLVGAARSGTTLLQGLIASSPEVFSFPETHFFSKTIPMRKSKRLLWRFLPKDDSIIRRFLETVECQDKEKLLQELPIKTISLKKWVKSLITLLDILTLEKKYKIWLEKTPFHLRYIDVIERSTIENIHFIHIIRNGLDVVASLYEATNKFPEKWGKARSIDSCINRWIRDIKISKKY